MLLFLNFISENDIDNSEKYHIIRDIKDMGQFAESIRLSINKIQEELDRELNKLALDTFKDVIQNTPSGWQDSPYAEGLLVNNWFPKVRGFSTETTSTKSLSGYDSFNRLTQLVDAKIFYKKDNSVTLTNNIDYAYRAEVLGWKPTSEHPNWKGAAPYGMIAKALIKAKSKV